jgi:hypothetical protein
MDVLSMALNSSTLRFSAYPPAKQGQWIRSNDYF